MKLLHLWRDDDFFEINFKPATKMPSKILLLKNLLTKSCKNILYVSAVNCYYTYICKDCSDRFFGLLFKTHLKSTYFDTSISLLVNKIFRVFLVLLLHV